MRTPLLLIHSEQDLRCPIEQAEQLFVQLRRIGKTEVEMVRFPEESHNLSRIGRPDRASNAWSDRRLVRQAQASSPG
jgi:dipeptidyl aminopeptidase/acylaminoacyl peptidase